MRTSITPSSRNLLALLLFLYLSIYSLSSLAVAKEKTPTDVYNLVQLLSSDVKRLQQLNNITSEWPSITAEIGRAPRHVFQKAVEVLNKINKYRINIARIGGITVPRYPGRDITPNEVFSIVERLRQELNILLALIGQEQGQIVSSTVSSKQIYTSNEVYTTLSEVSIALEQTLGLRGITPSEVFTRSLKVVRLARFLRKSQGLPLNIPKLTQTQGKLPNHALRAVLDLLKKVQKAEKNLWMKPLSVPNLPRQVIKPSDVYDAMGVALAELQRIQFRLGLERDIPDPKPQADKTPDDVIYNAHLAATLLPLFSLDYPLQQYDRVALTKTSNQVFSISDHILKRLQRYRRLRGVQVPARKTNVIHGLKPQHVYGKALEIMEKVDVLRQRQNMGAMAVPHYPLRTITPSEVFDLALRLDSELALIHQLEEPDIEIWSVMAEVREFEDKQPSDVFFNMQRISNLLDTILGTKGFTPNDVYREVLSTSQEINQIAISLGGSIPEDSWMSSELKLGIEPREVLAMAGHTLDLIVQAKRRAGMFEVQQIIISEGDTVTPSDVFNQVRLIGTELTELKVFLDIQLKPAIMPPQSEKTPAHVLRVLEGIDQVLHKMLHTQHTSDPQP